MLGLSGRELEDRLKSCSRHRQRHTPPKTPPGFWDSGPILTSPKKINRSSSEQPKRKKPKYVLDYTGFKKA